MNAPLSQMPLPLRAVIPPDMVQQQQSLLDAILLCIQASGKEAKSLYLDLSIDKGHWSRIMAGKAHFPIDELEDLMQLCGNDIPLQWLAWRRGMGLHLLESEQQRLMREKDEQIRELQQQLKWATDLFRGKVGA